MRKDYSVGMENNKINLDVTIGTPGIAHTTVFQYFPGGEHKKLVESDVDSANIKQSLIGEGKELIGSYIKIRTVIDFLSIDSSQWELLAQKISGIYNLSGGFGGSQSYTYDADDKTIGLSGRIVVIDKEFNLNK